jgi:hypothetical protein
MNLLHQINQQKIKQNLLNKKTLDNKYNLPRLMRGFLYYNYFVKREDIFDINSC